MGLTAAEWTSRNLILGVNKFGVESDTGKFKIGDGKTPWNSLSYPAVSGSSSDTIGNCDGGIPDTEYGGAINIDGGDVSGN